MESYFGSAKNFYCCRYFSPPTLRPALEVLRISTVVDAPALNDSILLWKC